MKKLVVLVGLAAAVYGAKKLFTGKDEPARQPYGATEYGGGYGARQPQDEQAA